MLVALNSFSKAQVRTFRTILIYCPLRKNPLKFHQTNKQKLTPRFTRRYSSPISLYYFVPLNSKSVWMNGYFNIAAHSHTDNINFNKWTVAASTTYWSAVAPTDAWIALPVHPRLFAYTSPAIIPRVGGWETAIVSNILFLYGPQSIVQRIIITTIQYAKWIVFHSLTGIYTWI